MTVPRMTPEQLASIQARADAATEGPWKAYDRGIGYEIHHAEDWAINDRHRETFTKADAEFTAHARTDVPALLALVREQTAKLGRVEAMHVREVIAVHEGSGEEAICVVCAKYWPCKTIAALTATEGA